MYLKDQREEKRSLSRDNSQTHNHGLWKDTNTNIVTSEN